MATTGGVQKTLAKLKANVSKGDYYEAFQMYHSISQRYIKQKKFEEAASLLHDGALNMLEHQQNGSANDLCERLVDVYKSQGTTVEKARSSLLEIFYKYPLRTSHCEQYVQLIMKFTSEDLQLHHAIGLFYLQDGDYFNAEYHLLRGTMDSAKILGRLEHEFSQLPEAAAKNEDRGYFLCRAVLPLLVVGKVEEALACFDAFKLLMQDTEFIDHDRNKETSKHPLYNFALLILLVVLKSAGDKFGSVISAHLEALEFDDVLLECANKIGAVYFKIGVREQPTNPFADMFKQMMSGPAAQSNNTARITEEVDFD